MELLTQDITKLLIAVLVGGLIGTEREVRRKAAGFRTIILITVGSTLFTIVSIALGGEKVTLRITAEHADEWNVWGTVDTLKSKMAILDAHCVRLGRDPKTIQRSAVALLFMSDDREYLKKMRDARIPQAANIGTVEEIRAIVAQYQAIGVDELIVPDFTLGPTPQKIATLDRFIREVAGR